MKPERCLVPGFQIGRGCRVVPNSALPAALSQVIINLVPQNTRKPGALGGLAGKPLAAFDGREKGFLDNVLGHTHVAHLADGKVEEVIGVGFHPIATQRRVTVTLCFYIRGGCHSDYSFCKARATNPFDPQIVKIPCKIRPFRHPLEKCVPPHACSRPRYFAGGRDTARRADRCRFASLVRSVPSPRLKPVSAMPMKTKIPFLRHTLLVV